jgi:hypothetical protein
VKGKLRIGLEIGKPISSSGRAGDIEPTVQIVEPYFYAARLARFSAGGRDVNRPILFKSPSHFFVHVILHT